MGNVYAAGANASTLYSMSLRRNFRRGPVVDFVRVEGMPVCGGCWWWCTTVHCALFAISACDPAVDGPVIMCCLLLVVAVVVYY